MRYRKFRATLRTFLLRFAKEEQVNSSDFSQKIPINKEGGIEFFDIKFKFLPKREKYVIFTFRNYRIDHFFFKGKRRSKEKQPGGETRPCRIV